MFFDLSNEMHARQFALRVQRLQDKGAMVELVEKSLQTHRQNNYLHLLIGAVALETGTTLEYAKEYYYKRAANAALYVVRRRDELLGGEVETVRSQRDLTREELAFSIDRFKLWADTNGIYLPDEADEVALREINLQMAIAKKYL